MKIAFVMNSLVTGGAETHTVALADQLRQRGHHALIVPLMHREGVPVPDGLPCRVLGGNGLLSFGSMRRLGKMLADFGPDVIVAANERPLKYAHMAKLFGGLRAPIVSIYHTTKLFSAKQKLFHRLALPFFRRSDLLIYVSANQQKYWSSRGLRARRETVILNGIDTDRFSAGPALLRAQLGIGADDFVVGLSAAFRPEKNHRQAIDAVSRLRRAGLPAHLLLIGDGPERQAIEAAARASDAAGVTHFVGPQADVVPYLRCCDVGVLCSVAIETFSLAALEFMGAGVPMVMSDIGGASEMIVDGQTGFLFPAGDTESLARILAELAGDRALTKTLGSRAAARIRDEFDIEQMVDRYERIFLQVASVA